MHILKDELNQMGYAIGMQKGCNLQNRINELLIKYHENWILKYLQTKWINNPTRHYDAEKPSAKQLGINNFGALFTILLIVIVLSGLWIIVATLANKFSRKEEYILEN